MDADSRVAVGVRRSDCDQRAGAAYLVSTRLASYPGRGRRAASHPRPWDAGSFRVPARKKNLKKI